MSSVEKWMKSHVGILFITLECVWEFDMEISCKEVAYSYMWIDTLRYQNMAKMKNDAKICERWIEMSKYAIVGI
jgi:hypothetical protein